MVALGCGLPIGCGQPASELEFTSYKDPYFPETYHVTLDECAYRVGAGGDMHIAGRAASEAGDTETRPTTQLLHVHVFWQPKPGVTFANTNTTDATIRYAVVTGAGTAIYSGTGFVYPERQQGGALSVKIETANLRLESLGGNAPEVFGDARLSGNLWPREDAHTAVDLMRALELHAGGRQKP